MRLFKQGSWKRSRASTTSIAATGGPAAAVTSSCRDLARLASKSQWEAFLAVLRTPHGLKQARAVDFVGNTLLHVLAAVRDVPVEVVRVVIMAWPGALTEGDVALCLPLHDAAALGARPEVVREILKSRVEAAVMLDREERSPLHNAVRRACEEYRRLDSGSKGRGSKSLSKRSNKSSTAPDEKITEDRLVEALDVIKILCRAAPEAIHAPDRSGASPIDIAQMGGGQKGPVFALLQLETQRARCVGRSSSMTEDSQGGDESISSSVALCDSWQSQRDVEELRELMEWTRRRSSSDSGSKISRSTAA